MSHIHEKLDYVADVFVVHQDKVLLRMHDKYNMWLGVGGHIEIDENPDTAAVREVKEEVGLDVTIVPIPWQIGNNIESGCGEKEIIPPRYMNRHSVSGTHDHISLTYFALSDTDQVVPGGHDRSDTWKWFSRHDLNDSQYDLPPKIRFYATRALEALAKK